MSQVTSGRGNNNSGPGKDVDHNSSSSSVSSSGIGACFNTIGAATKATAGATPERRVEPQRERSEVVKASSRQQRVQQAITNPSAGPNASGPVTALSESSTGASTGNSGIIGTGTSESPLAPNSSSGQTSSTQRLSSINILNENKQRQLQFKQQESFKQHLEQRQKLIQQQQAELNDFACVAYQVNTGEPDYMAASAKEFGGQAATTKRSTSIAVNPFDTPPATDANKQRLAGAVGRPRSATADERPSSQVSGKSGFLSSLMDEASCEPPGPGQGKGSGASGRATPSASEGEPAPGEPPRAASEQSSGPQGRYAQVAKGGQLSYNYDEPEAYKVPLYKRDFATLLQDCRASRKLVILIVAIALLLDNMLLTSVVPIIPAHLYKMRIERQHREQILKQANWSLQAGQGGQAGGRLQAPHGGDTDASRWNKVDDEQFEAELDRRINQSLANAKDRFSGSVFQPRVRLSRPLAKTSRQSEQDSSGSNFAQQRYRSAKQDSDAGDNGANYDDDSAGGDDDDDGNDDQDNNNNNNDQVARQRPRAAKDVDGNDDDDDDGGGGEGRAWRSTGRKTDQDQAGRGGKQSDREEKPGLPDDSEYVDADRDDEDNNKDDDSKDRPETSTARWRAEPQAAREKASGSPRSVGSRRAVSASQVTGAPGSAARRRPSVGEPGEPPTSWSGLEDSDDEDLINSLRWARLRAKLVSMAKSTNETEALGGVCLNMVLGQPPGAQTPDSGGRLWRQSAPGAPGSQQQPAAARGSSRANSPARQRWDGGDKTSDQTNPGRPKPKVLKPPARAKTDSRRPGEAPGKMVPKEAEDEDEAGAYANQDQMVISHQDIVDESFEVGVMFASKPIVQAFANPFIGTLTNKVGFTIPMFTGFVIMFLSTLVFAFGSSYSTLFVARAIQGVGSACTSVAGMSMLADRFPDDAERGHAMAIALGGLALGVVIGPPFGGFMYEFVGKSSPFIVLSVLALLDGLLQLMVLQPRVTESQEEGASLMTLIKDPYILVAAGAITFANTGIAILEPALPLWMMDTMQAKNWEQGVAFLPAALSYMFGTNLFGNLGHKIGRWRATMIGLIIIGFSLLLIPFATRVDHLIIPNGAIGFAMGMVDSTMMPMLGYLVDIRHTSVYGSVYAIGDVAFCASFAFGPALSGTLVELVGFEGLIVTTALICFCFAPLLLLLRNPPARQLDGAQMQEQSTLRYVNYSHLDSPDEEAQLTDYKSTAKTYVR